VRIAQKGLADVRSAKKEREKAGQSMIRKLDASLQRAKLMDPTQKREISNIRNRTAEYKGRRAPAGEGGLPRLKPAQDSPEDTPPKGRPTSSVAKKK